MTEKGAKYCNDILRAIELVEDFVEDTESFDQFLSDPKTQSAVERQLGVTGEALKNLLKAEPDLNVEHHEKIIGFRNRLIHSYDRIDRSII
mgnify:CR=1 FL=1